jgi:hypothetical protein
MQQEEEDRAEEEEACDSGDSTIMTLFPLFLKPGATANHLTTHDSL